MSVQVSTKTSRARMVSHTAHSRKDIVRKPELQHGRAANVTVLQDGGEVSAKERVYFEYAIENEPLLQDTVGLLIDGDAYPCEYSGKPEPQLENSAHIHWGRVVRDISESVSFTKPNADLVEATIVTTVEGAMKIAAPYHLSRRKRHAVLFKPFKETCTRKVSFQRQSRSSDPAQAWKMAMISGAQGGTEHSEATIEALRLNLEGNSVEARSAFTHSFILNGNEHPTPLFHANQGLNIEMVLRSGEMEQNMVVVRSMLKEDAASRVQLQLRSDVRQECEYCQTYAGTMTAGTFPGVQSVVLEAIVRSSLYDTGAPISSSFWVFPVVIL